MLTIQELIQKIQSELPEAMPGDTVDTLKSGDGSRPIQGIVTTFIATWEVIQKAAELGANLIITHEPTYFNHRDETAWLEKDSTFQAKRRLIEEKGLTIWRFHDGWHMHRPDGILTGVVEQLKWQNYQDSQFEPVFKIPSTSLRSLAEEFKQKLNAPVLRVVGADSMECRQVFLFLGSGPGEIQIEILGNPAVDVLVCGETTEWQVPEYVRDSTAAGLPKGLIILGHERSEEGGMLYLAKWLQQRFPDLAVSHLPAGDPLRYL